MLIILLIIIFPVAIIDIKIKKIPDLIIYPGIILLYSYKSIVDVNLMGKNALLLIVGFISFFIIWYSTRGKMGLGDAKLSAFLCLSLGMKGWFLMLFLSSFAAVLFALLMLKLKKMNKNSKIPYAPFLCFGAIISYFII